jgi:hypothetical protein
MPQNALKPYSSCERNVIEVFPNLTKILKIYMTLPMGFRTKRNFSKLSTITSQLLTNTLEEILNYVSTVPIENYITQWLPYGEAIRVCSQNMFGEKKLLQRRVRQLINKNTVLFIWIMWRLWYHHHHHHHLLVMELGHLLTRSGLTYPEVSSKVCHDSFCQLGNSVSSS